jgi:hypothetical protein
MKKILILARYNENIEWCLNLNFIDQIIIINKGMPLENNKNIIVNNLPNFGRESNSYLNYIIKNYNEIEKNNIYIFSQANPFDNSLNFVQKILNITEFTGCLPLSDIVSKESIFALKRPGDITIPNGLPFINYYNHLFFNENLIVGNNSYINFHCNGLWAVSGENLLFRNREFYEHCLTLIKSSANPIEGYLFERLWQFIFDGTTLDWHSHYQEIRKKYIGGIYKNSIIE